MIRVKYPRQVLLVVVAVVLSAVTAMVIATMGRAAVPMSYRPTQLSVDWDKVASWSGGYRASVTVTNDASDSVDNWRVEFDLPDGSIVGNYWDGLMTSSENHYTFTNREYNGTIEVDQSVTFGFLVVGDGDLTDLTATSATGPGRTARPTPTNTASPAKSPSPSPSPTRRHSRSPSPAPSPTASPSPSPTASPFTKQICIGSWYGTDDETPGGTTASGEEFDNDAYTAAHQTLPFGTTVRVTNLANGKSVTVRINDRGPTVPGRCIELTRAAFEDVEDLDTGLFPAKVQIVQD